MDDSTPTALKLKAIRERLGISIRAIAERIGMSASGYGHYEDPDRFKDRYLPMKIARPVARAMQNEEAAAEVMALAMPTGRENGFADGDRQPRIDVLGALGEPSPADPSGGRPHNLPGDAPGTIRIATVDGLIQVAATVDAASFDKLLRKLELARKMIEDED